MKGKRLSDIEEGKSVFLDRIEGKGSFIHRMHEMGFVRGKVIRVIKNAPFNDPIEFSIMGYHVSLRRSEASHIVISDTGIPERSVSHTDLSRQKPSITVPSGAEKVIRVAMVGNPNSGKTSIFNYASKSHERVGNYSGVTVASKTSLFKMDGEWFEVTDLPGTYSITAFTPEEQFVRNHILTEKPDVVINIVDASNLERNLYLTTQLIDMNVPIVVALNMFDELVMRKDHFDFSALGRMLGFSFVPTIGSRGRGITKLFRKVAELSHYRASVQHIVRINYGSDIEIALTRIEEGLASATLPASLNSVSLRYVALGLLTNDTFIIKSLQDQSGCAEALALSMRESHSIESLLGENINTLITQARYGFISGALKETYHPGSVNRRSFSEKLDRLITNRVVGFPLFLLFMWLMFTATFRWGAYPQHWLDMGIQLLNQSLNEHLPEGTFKQLLTDGIIGGAGGVLIFLPNILILFFFIALMEDTGYMARAVFITDKLMHKLGLHGKSFIPLIMGFGCNVPAIMATRTIENRNNRILTMLMNPFMSCSARLPVYILLVGTIFPNHKGTFVFFLYFIGIFFAVSLALLFKYWVFKKADVPFVMELPPYRFPTLRSISKHMWQKAVQYLRKMGGVILAAAIIIWALGYFPVNRTSYLNRIGMFVEPGIRPLGFDWRMGVCLLSGVAAKEIVVSTMGVVFTPDVSAGNSDGTAAAIKNAVHTHGPDKGKPLFTPLATLSFLLFTLLYFPCMATLSAIRYESGSWKWAMLSVFMNTSLAWLTSFVFFRLGTWLFT